MSIRAILWAMLFMSVATPASADAPVTADTPSATASGATFMTPRAWSLDRQETLSVVSPPEEEFQIAIVDIGDASNATAAITAAWRRHDPSTIRPVKIATQLPPRSGWDEHWTTDYETSPNERLFVQATALRQGKNWTVLLVHGPLAVLEKRAAAFVLVLQSLRPKGYHPESFGGKVAHRLDAGHIADLTAFVTDSMHRLGIPGASIALIDQGKVVYEGGFGVRALGKPAAVDAHTRFLIASNTKGLSTLLLAKAVDVGRLSWNAPVTSVYPAFKLGSPETTRKVLVRQLVCACTGLPRKDLVWAMTNRPDTPAASVFDQLAGTEPTSGFGEVYQYNNLMAAAAGYVAGHLFYPDRELGDAYNAAMQREIFGPLGMSDTTFDFAKVRAGDVASPHGQDMGGKPALADIDVEQTAIAFRPAGGAWSSAHDLIRYVGLELSEGTLPNGRRLVSAANLLARRAPSVAMGEGASYGMGLRTETMSGIPIVSHGGSMPGYMSDVIAIPGAQVGAVILTNADSGGALLQPFKRRLMEILYDGAPQAAADVAAAAVAMQAAQAGPQPSARGAATMAIIADRYMSPELGHITVLHDAGGLIFDFGTWRTHVGSVKNGDGTVSLVAIDPAMPKWPFVVTERDGKRALIVREAQHEYVYLEALPAGN